MLVGPSGPRRIGGSDGRVSVQARDRRWRSSGTADADDAVPDMRIGDVISLGRRQLRVVDKRDDDADQAPVLVEDVAE